MKYLVRFFLIVATGTAGAKAIERNAIAGIIFFILSILGIVSTLDSLGIVNSDEWGGVLLGLLAVLVTIISSIADAIAGLFH